MQLGMSPGFKVFQTRPQIREIVLQHGESWSNVMNNPEQIIPDVVLTRRMDRYHNSQLHVALYETGIALIITAYERAQEYNVDFKVMIPRNFQNKIRGFCGNLDSVPTNEFYSRSEMDLTLHSDSITERELLSVFQSCKFQQRI